MDAELIHIIRCKFEAYYQANSIVFVDELLKKESEDRYLYPTVQSQWACYRDGFLQGGLYVCEGYQATQNKLERDLTP